MKALSATKRNFKYKSVEIRVYLRVEKNKLLGILS